MKGLRSGLVVAGALLLGACASTPEPKVVAAPAPKVQAPKPVAVAPAPRPLFSIEAGTYQCELNRQVELRNVSASQDAAELRWGQQSYQMQAVKTATGALRLENKESGLTWITIVGKSMLLNTKRGKQLANECRI
ncbi:MAG: MliC family protein [Burkholderiaceae bacterium]